MIGVQQEELFPPPLPATAGATTDERIVGQGPDRRPAEARRLHRARRARSSASPGSKAPASRRCSACSSARRRPAPARSLSRRARPAAKPDRRGAPRRLPGAGRPAAERPDARKAASSSTSARSSSARWHGRLVPLVRPRHGLARAQRQIDSLRIKARSPWSLANQLSGGNQQKVVIGKWLEIAPQVMLLDDPTRGVDVGAKREIYGLIREMSADRADRPLPLDRAARAGRPLRPHPRASTAAASPVELRADAGPTTTRCCTPSIPATQRRCVTPTPASRRSLRQARGRKRDSHDPTRVHDAPEAGQAWPSTRSWHDNIWPELVAEIEESGIAKMTIFENDPVLFLYSEIADEDAWDRLWHTAIHDGGARSHEPADGVPRRRHRGLQRGARGLPPRDRRGKRGAGPMADQQGTSRSSRARPRAGPARRLGARGAAPTVVAVARSAASLARRRMHRSARRAASRASIRDDLPIPPRWRSSARRRARLGAPTILVNAAGVFGPIWPHQGHATPAQWIETIDDQRDRAYLTCRAFLGRCSTPAGAASSTSPRRRRSTRPDRSTAPTAPPRSRSTSSRATWRPRSRAAA